MTTRSSVPSAGPDAVLRRLATHLKLPFAPEQITMSVAAHPRPTSLLALVEVAQQLGVTLKPGKADAEVLGSLESPFVAHFSDNGGGFAVVEGTTEEGFELWDGATGRRFIDNETFRAHWSGIVAVIESAPEPESRSASAKKRLADLIAGAADPPDVASGTASWAARSVIAIPLIGLISIAIATSPAGLRVPILAIALLALAGLVLASVMAAAISSYAGPFSPGLCGRGRFVDCQSVLTSRFARVAGFALSDLGTSLYAAVLLLIACAAVAPVGPLRSALGLVFVATVPAAIVLIGIQLAIRRLCTFCLGTHAINIAGAVVGLRYLLRDGPPIGDVVPALLLFALFFCLVLFFAIPYVKKSGTLAHLSETYARMAMSSFASLAQLLTERPTGLAGDTHALPLNDAPGRDELIAFLHPACNQCEPILRELRGLTMRSDVQVFVTLPPKDDRERPLSEAVLAAGVARGPDAFVTAYKTVKDRFRELIKTGSTIDLGVPVEELDVALPRARELVARTEEFAAVHVEGTPALFFNGLVFRGPLPHLMDLLENHTGLLPRRDRNE